MIKNIRKVIFLFFLVNLILACNEKNPVNGFKISENSYSYCGYDSLGVQIIEGELTIVFEDSSNLKGNWELAKIGNPVNIGPQVGSGNLTGIYEDDTIYIDFNPNFRDNNVSLSGKIKSDSLIGTWSYSGYPGIINYGSFKAIKL